MPYHQGGNPSVVNVNDACKMLMFWTKMVFQMGHSYNNTATIYASQLWQWYRLLFCSLSRLKCLTASAGQHLAKRKKTSRSKCFATYADTNWSHVCSGGIPTTDWDPFTDMGERRLRHGQCLVWDIIAHSCPDNVACGICSLIHVLIMLCVGYARSSMPW